MQLRVEEEPLPTERAYVRERGFGKVTEGPTARYVLQVPVPALIDAIGDYYVEYGEDDLLERDTGEFVADIDLALRALAWPPLRQLATEHPSLLASFIAESDYHILLKLLSTSGSAQTRTFWINSVSRVTVDSEHVYIEGVGFGG
ncbi:MAG: hypothetical protein AAF500_21625 [Myxococcota bacterium]